MAPVTDATTAAENYRRARELFERSRAELIEASMRERDTVNLAGLARRAGLHKSTLYHWVYGPQEETHAT